MMTSWPCRCSYQHRLVWYTIAVLVLLLPPVSLFATESASGFTELAQSANHMRVFRSFVRHEIAVSHERTAEFFRAQVAEEATINDVLFDIPNYQTESRALAAAGNTFIANAAVAAVSGTDVTSSLPRSAVNMIDVALERWSETRESKTSINKLFEWDGPISCFVTYSTILRAEQEVIDTMLNSPAIALETGNDLLQAATATAELLERHMGMITQALYAQKYLSWDVEVATDFLRRERFSWGAFHFFVREKSLLPILSNRVFGLLQAVDAKRKTDFSHSPASRQWMMLDRQLQLQYSAIEASTTTNIASCRLQSWQHSIVTVSGSECLHSFPVQAEQLVQEMDAISAELEGIVDALLSEHEAAMRSQRRRHALHIAMATVSLALVPVLLWATRQVLSRDAEWRQAQVEETRKSTALQTLKQSVGYVCNELRNPLHAMLASLELIGEHSSMLSTDCRLALAMLRKSAANLKVFSQDILDLQRVQDGSFRPTLGVGTVEEDLAAGLQLARAYIGRGVRTQLLHRGDARDQPTVLDHHRLVQVVLAACTGLDQLYCTSRIVITSGVVSKCGAPGVLGAGGCGESGEAAAGRRPESGGGQGSDYANFRASPGNNGSVKAHQQVGVEASGRKDHERIEGSTGKKKADLAQSTENDSSSFSTSSASSACSGSPSAPQRPPPSQHCKAYLTLLDSLVEEGIYGWGSLSVVIHAVVESSRVEAAGVRAMMRQMDWTSLKDPKGLSLSLCGQTAEAMGGTIRVSTEDKPAVTSSIPRRTGHPTPPVLPVKLARSDPGRPSTEGQQLLPSGQPEAGRVSSVVPPAAPTNLHSAAWTAIDGRPRGRAGLASRASSETQLQTATAITIRLALPVAVHLGSDQEAAAAASGLVVRRDGEQDPRVHSRWVVANAMSAGKRSNSRSGSRSSGSRRGKLVLRSLTGDSHSTASASKEKSSSRGGQRDKSGQIAESPVMRVTPAAAGGIGTRSGSASAEGHGGSRLSEPLGSLHEAREASIEREDSRTEPLEAHREGVPVDLTEAGGGSDGEAGVVADDDRHALGQLQFSFSSIPGTQGLDNTDGDSSSQESEPDAFLGI